MGSNTQLRKQKKRVRERYSSCCRNCKDEGIRDWEATERLALMEDEQKQEEELQGGVGVVDLHPHGIQMLITVNAPRGFELYLDFLPCFQGPPVDFVRFQGPNVINNGWIAGASNGLLLCSYSKLYQSLYYVCNPVTKSWLALPPTPMTHNSVFVGFVFDPCTNFTNQDLHGSLPCSNSCRFKVVRFRQLPQISQPQFPFEAEIFSSDTGKWSVSAMSPMKEFQCDTPELERPPRKEPLSSLFHNGCLHWFAAVMRMVVVYDPYINKLRGIIQPPPVSQCCQGITPKFLGLSRNSLWMFHFSSQSLYIRLWQLKGYDSDSSGNFNLDECYWSPHRFCSLRDIKGMPRVWWLLDFCKLLAIHPHDPDILYFQFNIYGSFYVVACNLRTKAWGPIRFGYRGCDFNREVLTLPFPAM